MKINTARVSRKFSRLAALKLIEFIRNFVTLMTGYAKTPTPMPPLIDVTAAVETYAGLCQTALAGDHSVILARDQFRPGLVEMVYQEANYVQFAANGDPQVVVDAGFELIPPKGPKAPVFPPTNLTGKRTTMGGQIYLAFKRSKGANNYTIQMSTTQDGPWTEAMISPKCRNYVSNLTPGTTYWFRVRANGAAGPSGWSDLTSIMAA